MAAHSFVELRAWQVARTFKLAVYSLIAEKPLALDVRLCEQLRESARSAVSHVAEGYGRFYPADFARFLSMAKASLIEAQNHLQDAVDLGHISVEQRDKHHGLADAALRDVTALIEYLQSPRAAANAKNVRATRQARRARAPEHDKEPGT